jgi:serine protease Do
VHTRRVLHNAESSEQHRNGGKNMNRKTWVFAIALTISMIVAGCGSSIAAQRGATAQQKPLVSTSAPTPALAGGTAASATLASSEVAQVSSAAAPAAASASSALSALEQGFEAIYAQMDPSVVLIQVVVPASSSSQTAQHALGSGFVWNKDGNVVTNNHVVDGASSISVTFYDGTTVSAKVVGADPDSDLAVLKVDVAADRLQPVTLADSTQVKVGQIVIAIGNPFGEQNTMTTGIISALGRTLPAGEGTAGGSGYTIPDVIQTDAPINPGNSGGVLLDASGQLVGVTAAIESSVNSSAGIGFAIPSVIVQRVVPVLIATGHFEHPWLGISGGSLTPDLAKAMNLQQDQRGALVEEVVSGSPADKAGIQSSTKTATILGQQVQVGGDVIIAIDGRPVKTFEDVTAYLARYGEVSQTVTLTILRGGKQEDIRVLLQARPAATASGSQGATVPAYLGVTGISVTPDIAKAMNLATSQQGVLVQQVASGSPADQVGLIGSTTPVTINGNTVMVGGDIITAFGSQPVTSLDGLNSLLAQASPGDIVTLTVMRSGRQGRVRIMLDQQPTSELQTTRFVH